MNKPGFTLVELLVVVAIIGILAAIIFPIYASTREKARQTTCSSNLRQIGMGLIQYVDDNDETMPNSYWGSFAAPSDDNANYKWMDAIYPYVKSEMVFDCPDDPYSPPYHYRSGTSYGSYGENGAYKSGNLEIPPRSATGKTVQLSQITQPSETVWATDCNNSDLTHPGGSSSGSYGFTWPDPLHNPVIVTIADGARQLNQISERHQGRAGVLYCDAHVKSQSLNTLAATHSEEDPAFGGAVNVMYQFTIEED